MRNFRAVAAGILAVVSGLFADGLHVDDFRPAYHSPILALSVKGADIATHAVIAGIEGERKQEKPVIYTPSEAVQYSGRGIVYSLVSVGWAVVAIVAGTIAANTEGTSLEGAGSTFFGVSAGLATGASIAYLSVGTINFVRAGKKRAAAKSTEKITWQIGPFYSAGF